MGSTAPSERAPTAAVIEAVTGAAGAAPRKWQRVTGGGYTPAERWLIELDDGSRAFAKVATVGYTQEWLRTEHRAYLEIAGPFMPRLLGWSETPIPALLLEDLSGAHWPPPWDSEMVDRVRAALGDVSRAPCPAWAVPAAGMSDVFGGWSEIADDPEAFLELGMVSRGWLDAALPMLIAHERPPDLEGDALLHFDVRPLRRSQRQHLPCR